jgi:hypothetical protein
VAFKELTFFVETRYSESIDRYCQVEDVAGTVGRWTAMPPVTTDTGFLRRSSVTPCPYRKSDPFEIIGFAPLLR